MKKFIERTVKEIPDVEQPATQYAISRGWKIVKLNTPGERGNPDRLAARKGKVVLVEFKAPGETPKEQQLIRHAEWRAAGVEVHWIDNLEDAKAVFR